MWGPRRKAKEGNDGKMKRAAGKTGPPCFVLLCVVIGSNLDVFLSIRFIPRKLGQIGGPPFGMSGVERRMDYIHAVVQAVRRAIGTLN